MDKRNVSGDVIGLIKDFVCMLCDYLGDIVFVYEILYSMIIKMMVDYEIILLKCYIEKLYCKIVVKYLF